MYMYTPWVFIVGMIVTLALCLVVVEHLKPPLRKVLFDLCHTQERADFWTAFCDVTLMLAPALLAMSIFPSANPYIPPFFKIIFQVKWALLVLIGALLMLGVIIGGFIMKGAEKA